MERLSQKIKIQKRELANYLENVFNGILNIFHRSGPRAPDPKTGSSPPGYKLNCICSEEPGFPTRSLLSVYQLS